MGLCSDVASGIKRLEGKRGDVIEEIHTSNFPNGRLPLSLVCLHTGASFNPKFLY